MFILEFYTASSKVGSQTPRVVAFSGSSVRTPWVKETCPGSLGTQASMHAELVGHRCEGGGDREAGERRESGHHSGVRRFPLPKHSRMARCMGYCYVSAYSCICEGGRGFTQSWGGTGLRTSTWRSTGSKLRGEAMPWTCFWAAICRIIKDPVYAGWAGQSDPAPYHSSIWGNWLQVETHG